MNRRFENALNLFGNKVLLRGSIMVETVKDYVVATVKHGKVHDVA